jgi:hypothetical protein
MIAKSLAPKRSAVFGMVLRRSFVKMKKRIASIVGSGRDGPGFNGFACCGFEQKTK